MSKFVYSLVALLAVLLVASGLAGYAGLGTFEVGLQPGRDNDRSGALLEAARTSHLPRFVLQRVLDTVELPEPVSVANGVSTYRVRYLTTNHDGAQIPASGLVSVPWRDDVSSTVAYFHGTIAERAAAPSAPGLGEGMFVAIATSGAGHVMVAPDYLGLGSDRGWHPYLHKEATVAASLDLMIAARELLAALGRPWPERLYLTGFSQGGHAVLAVQHALQASSVLPRPQAAAPIAGPFQLRDISFPQALTGESESHSFYLGYLAAAYARIYRYPIESLLRAPYAKTLPPLYDGEHGLAAIGAALPDVPRDMFERGFLDTFDAGGSHWFLEALAANSVAPFAPAAPVRIYYGDADLDVLPDEALRAAREMSALGGDATAISVGNVGHSESALMALPRALAWFAELDGRAR